jgi:hypothetical protein
MVERVGQEAFIFIVREGFIHISKSMEINLNAVHWNNFKITCWRDSLQSFDIDSYAVHFDGNFQQSCEMQMNRRWSIQYASDEKQLFFL